MQKPVELFIFFLITGLITCDDNQTASHEETSRPETFSLSLQQSVTHAGHSARNSAWSHDNAFVAVVSYDSDAYIYDKEFNLIETITLSEERVRSVSWSPDNRFLALGTEEPSVYIFHTSELGQGAEPVYALYDFGCRVNGLHFSPDSVWLAAGSGCSHRDPDWTGDLVIMEVDNDFAEVRRFGQMDESYGVRWSPSGNYLGTTGTGIDNNLYVFDTSGDRPESWQLHTFLENPYDGQSLSSLDWTRDERFLAVAGIGSITLYEVSGMTFQTQIPLPDEDDARVWRVRFSPDGRFLGVCDDNRSSLYRVDNADPSGWHVWRSVDDQPERYFTNSWSTDSRYWTVGNEDGSVHLYHLSP